MSTNLYLVFSKRPESVSASDYDRWYETHAQENIESPGFLDARRFELGQVNGAAAPYEDSRCTSTRARWTGGAPA